MSYQRLFRVLQCIAIPYDELQVSETDKFSHFPCYFIPHPSSIPEKNPPFHRGPSINM